MPGITKTQYKLGFLLELNMTAAPDTIENITSVRVEVEDSLVKPETNQTDKFNNIERFFMKNKPESDTEKDSFTKKYDFNVMSEVVENDPQERSIPIVNDDINSKFRTKKKYMRNPQDEKDKPVNDDIKEGKDDIIPLYLHIPKSKECPNFCITINVEITRTGRQIKSKCRKSLICKNKKK